MRTLSLTLSLFLSLSLLSAQETGPKPAARWQHGVTMGMDFGQSTYTDDRGYYGGGWCDWGNCCGFAGCYVPPTRTESVSGLTLGYQLLRVRDRFGYGGTAEIVRAGGNAPGTMAAISGVVEFTGRQEKIRPFLRAQLGTVTPFGLGGGDARGLNVGWIANPSVGYSFGRSGHVSFDIGYRYTHLNYRRKFTYAEREERNLDTHRWLGRLTFRL